jgi:hypothetical protein
MEPSPCRCGVADQLGHITTMLPLNRAHTKEKSDKPPP